MKVVEKLQKTMLHGAYISNISQKMCALWQDAWQKLSELDGKTKQMESEKKRKHKKTKFTCVDFYIYNVTLTDACIGLFHNEKFLRKILFGLNYAPDLKARLNSVCHSLQVKNISLGMLLI